MECLQIFSTLHVQNVTGRSAQKRDKHKDYIEHKSVVLCDDELYSIICDLVAELYLDCDLKHDHSFLNSASLTGRDKIFIKHVSIYLCHVVLGHSMRKIAKGFELDRTSISYACRSVEDKRDDKSSDRFISACERLIVILAGRLLI